MDIFAPIKNMFGGNNGGTQVAAAPGAPQQTIQQAPQPAPAPLAQQNPGAVPPAAPVAAPAAEPNPMDTLQNIWQAPPNAPAPQADPFATPLLNSDPAKLQAAAAKIDFTAGIAPELMQKAMSGQDPQAFLQVLNHVGQRSLVTAAQLSTGMVENATRANNSRIMEALPNHVNSIQLSQMAPENPALAHPAAQPLLQLARAQIKANNPDLTPAQINQRAEQYLTGFGQAIAGTSQNGNQGQNGQPQQQQEPDWGALLGVPAQ